VHDEITVTRSEQPSIQPPPSLLTNSHPIWKDQLSLFLQQHKEDSERKRKRMSVTTNATTINKRTKASLSHANTDALCCEGGVWSRALYRYNVWTGLYMLEPHERIFFHIFGWMFLCSLVLYLGVFWNGFMDGLMDDDKTRGTTNK
jgi:hypothetical protein